MEARYADGVAMSRALTSALTNKEGESLLLTPHGGDFWAEHYDRAFVTSVGRAIAEINQAWLNDVGRWAQETSVGYVRTQLFRVRSIQHQVAAFCRSPSNDTSRLCEEDVCASWLHYLCGQGSGDEVALKQVLCFTSFADQERRRFANKSAPADESPPADQGLEEEATGESLAQQVSSKLESHESPELPLGTFVVSISARTDFRRLHVTGACPRVPGRHYSKFEFLSTGEPSVHSFHARCLHCFPESKGVQEVDVEVLSAQSPSTSGESSDIVSE